MVSGTASRFVRRTVARFSQLDWVCFPVVLLKLGINYIKNAKNNASKAIKHFLATNCL